MMVGNDGRFEIPRAHGLYEDLGPKNRYNVLCGQALLESYWRNDPELQVLSDELANKIEQIPYSHDAFDVVVAPLADRIEKTLDSQPYGKLEQSVDVIKGVRLQLSKTANGEFWIRLVSWTIVPNGTNTDKTVLALEGLFDTGVELTSSIGQTIPQQDSSLSREKRPSHERNSAVTWYRRGDQTIAVKTFREHDMGDGVRFGYNYFFSDEGLARNLWNSSLTDVLGDK